MQLQLRECLPAMYTCTRQTLALAFPLAGRENLVMSIISSLVCSVVIHYASTAARESSWVTPWRLLGVCLGCMYVPM